MLGNEWGKATVLVFVFMRTAISPKKRKKTPKQTHAITPRIAVHVSRDRVQTLKLLLLLGYLIFGCTNPLCDIPSGCCFFTGPWTVTRSSLRMLRRVAAFCRPLRPVLLLLSFPRSRSPVVGAPGLCWMWHGVLFARQWRPVVGVLRLCWLLPGLFDCFCYPRASVHRPPPPPLPLRDPRPLGCPLVWVKILSGIPWRMLWLTTTFL